MKISIIIVSYNVCNYLRQCLNSIDQISAIYDIEVIVVDNFSHDKTCDMIITEYPNVRLIQNLKNLGFAKAVNIGEGYAKGDYLCLLNPDTLLGENIFKILVPYLQEHPQVGCIGPKILNSDGTLQLSSKRSFPHPMTAFFKLFGLNRLFPKSRLFGRYNLTYLDENKILNVDALSGSFMLIPREVFKVVGNFDESFFMYGEDLDYCYRIQKCGYDLIYNPEVSIIHYKGESVKSAPFDMVKIFYSAMHTFYQKHRYDFSSWKFFKPFVFFSIYLHKISSYFSKYVARITAFLLDTFSITICFLVSLVIWYQFYHREIVTIHSIINHWPLLLDLIIAWAISSYLINLYNNNYLSYGRSLVTAAMTLLLSATSIYLIGIIAYSRMVLIMTIFLAALLIGSWRISLLFLYKYQKIKLSERTPLFSRRAVIIGTTDESMRIGKMLGHIPGVHFILLGYIDNQNKSGTEQFIGRIEDIYGLVKNHHINEILIPESWSSMREVIKLLHDLKDLYINWKFVPTGKNILVGKGMIENLSGVPLMNVELPLFEKVHKISKRIFDITFSSLLIFITMPYHVYYNLRGKVCKNIAWSIHGKHIHVYHYLSKKRIIQDMPLLLMIFKGSMSFVGTQIIDIKNKNPRLIVKPGLTGLIHLKASDIEFDSIRDFEQYYAMHYSLVFDIEIILKSIFRF